MDFALLRDAFWGLTFDGIALGAIYALISLGYTLVYGVLRLINFAHSEVFMIGTFASLVTATGLMGVNIEDDPRTGASMIFTLLVCLVIAMLASAITAVLVEIVAYRRLRQRGATKLATLISAIGVSISLVELFRIITDSLPREFPRVMDKTFLFSFAGADIRNDKVIGNLKGALFGGFALGLMETWTSAVFGTAWKAVISFVILVLVLLIKPTGLFGESIQQARV
jgi:branched-chain amino acid transport system permease protein